MKSIRVPQYSKVLRGAMFLLSALLFWSASDYLGDIISGYAFANGVRGTYIAIVATSFVLASLFLVVGARARAPLWLGNVNDSTRAR